MFAGEHINVSENRAVLHVALRMPRQRSLLVDGVDVVKEVHATLDRMAAFCYSRLQLPPDSAATIDGDNQQKAADLQVIR